MGLKDAVKSGRPFKRVGESVWCVIDKDGRIVLQNNGTYFRYSRHITKEDDLKVYDFEIQELNIPDWLSEDVIVCPLVVNMKEQV